MFYREAGQFKTSYAADQAVFPIRQDRIAIALILLVAFVAVPALASEYFLRAIFIPFLILSLAAIGLNVLVGDVAGLELAGLAVKHCLHPILQTRSMMRSPNRPCGRNSRKTRAST